MPVARSIEEIEAARDRAQAADFAAEDRNQHDESASTAYQLLQWLLGDSDTDPTAEYGLDDEVE